MSAESFICFSPNFSKAFDLLKHISTYAAADRFFFTCKAQMDLSLFMQQYASPFSFSVFPPNKY